MIRKLLDKLFGVPRYEVTVFFEGSLAKWSDGLPDAVRNDTLRRENNPCGQKYREILAQRKFRLKSSAITWGAGKCVELKGVFFYLKQ